jgi:Glycosyltransferase Family 4
MNFLFLSYYFPPLKSVGAIRAYEWAKQLRAKQHEITVLTTTNRHLLAQEACDLTQIEIQEAYTLDYRTVSTWLRPKNTFHFEENVKKKWWTRVSIRLKNTLPFSFFLDEGGILYIVISVFKAIKIIKKQKITHLISSYRPYATHLIAFCLKKIFKQKIHWTADFRDLQVDPFYGQYYFHRLQIGLNRFFLKRADMITTVSNGLAHSLKDFNSTVYVLRNGIDELNYHSKSLPTTHFNLVYTGTMFEGDGDLELFLNTLAEIITLIPNFASFARIEYAGKDASVWQQHLQHYPTVAPMFNNYGLVTRAEARQLQATAGINLLFSIAKSGLGGVLCGKLNEYLQVRQPIVVLINGVQDLEFEQIMGDLNAGIVIYNTNKIEEAKRLTHFILKQYDFWQINKGTNPVIPIEKLETWTWAFQTQQFLDKISNENVYQ